MKIIFENINEVNEFIKHWKQDNETKEENSNMEYESIIKDDTIGENNTYRKYAPTTVEKIPVLTEVYNDGSLQMKNQKTSKYTIFDLLNLKSKIPQVDKYKSWSALADAVKLNVHTCTRLSAGIELNYYDDLFNKWDNIKHPKFNNYGEIVI